MEPSSQGDINVEELLPPMQAAVADLRWRIAQLKIEIAASDERTAIRFLTDITNSTQGNTNSTYGDESDDMDSGSVAFLLFCTLLVLIMTTPGIMLYYSGQVT